MINIFILFFGVYLFAKIDEEHFKRHQFFKDHRSRFYLRALFILILGQLNWKITTGSALLFYALFDATLNMLMDWGYFNLGDTAKTDIFFRKYPFLYKTLKFICLLGGLALMII